MATEYRIYTNDGLGGPVDFTTPVATVSALTWTTPALPFNSDRTWVVRTHDTVTGLEDRHIDARFRQRTGPAGQDLSGLPAPPVGVTAWPRPGGAAVVRWTWPPGRGPTPTSFNVYAASPTLPAPGAGPQAPYGIAPAATAPYVGDFPYSASLSGLSAGWTGRVAVRAVNAAGEEGNLLYASLALPAAAPSPPDPAGSSAVP